MHSLPTPGRVFTLRPATTVVDGGGARLYNTSTDVINLEVGGLGFYLETANSSNPTATNGTTTAPLEVIYRIDKTQIKSPLTRRELERSGKINVWNRGCFRATIMKAQEPTNNAHLVELTNFVPEDEFSYLIISRVTGNMVDLYNSVRNHPSKQTDFKTPDFALANITQNAAKRDLLVQNLVAKYNDSNYPAANTGVALSLTSGLGQGVVTVANAAAAAVGTTYTIGYKLNGEPDTLTLTIGVKNALAAIEAQTAGLEILPYHLPGTTNAPVVPVAGSQGTTTRANAMAFIALNQEEPTFMYRHSSNSKLFIGLTTGFAGNAAVTQTEVSEPIPGEGLPNQSFLASIQDEFMTYSPGAGQRYAPNHVHYPSEYNPAGWYDQVRIEWCANGTSNIALGTQHHHAVTVLVPNFEVGEGVNAFWTGAINPQITDIRTVINAYISANSLPALVEYTA